MSESMLKIVNPLGLHARPAAKVVECANRFEAVVQLTHGDRKVNGKSIMGVLMLAAAMGTSITVSADGADEDVALLEIVALIENGFGELE